MNLLQLFWTVVLVAPLHNYVGYDSTGHRARAVSFTICETIRFESQIKTNAVCILQISESAKGGWETFGQPIAGPTNAGTTVTNIQELSVPRVGLNGQRFFRLVVRK